MMKHIHNVDNSKGKSVRPQLLAMSCGKMNSYFNLYEDGLRGQS